MSELIAEARVLVTPDTTTFRSLLTTELAAATKGVTVPVTVTPVVSATGAAAQASRTASKEAAAAEAALTKVAQAETILATADAKIVTSSTQAAAARSQFTAATRASLVSEAAYRKALASEDEDTIAAAAATRALVREKQSLALATLRAAQATAAEGAARSRSTAAGEVAGATDSARAAAAITKTSASAAAAQTQLARATDLVAVAERRAAAATTEVSAAQIRYQASISATAASFKAYQASLESSDLLLVKQTRDAFAAAKGNEALALSNLNVARTESSKTAALSKGAAAQAASLSQVSRGAGSAGASLLGVRGATLAATAPFLAGAAGAIALTRALGAFSGFQQQLSVFAATTGATADELDRVSASAKQLGRDITLPGVSAGDAAESMTEFAKAGLSVNDAIAATRGGLQLATAAQLSNADAVELTANALNAFKLSGDQAVSVADTLANAANAAQGSIADIGLGLKQAAGAAAVVGVSFQDTTALLTLLAKNGLTASDAGTSLRTAFIRLVNPSKQAQKILSDLNVQLRDAEGNVRPEVFAEFADAQKDLAVSTQQANAAIVFGQDAFRAFGVLSREGTSGLRNTRAELEKTGTASRIAGARMVGMAGAAANLSNQLETLGITLGKVLSGPATGFVTGLGNFVESLNEVSDKVGAFVKPTTIDDASASVGTLIDRVQGLQRAAQFAPDENFARALIQGADEVEKALTDAGKNLVQQGFLKRFITDFTEASPDVKKAMEDNVITPAEQAVLQASAVGRAFLAALPHTSEFFQSFGLSAKDAVEQAAAALRDPAPIAAALRSNIEDATAAAKSTAASAGAAHGKTIVNAIATAITAGRKAISDAIEQLPSASSVLSRDIAVAQAAGNQNQELALLREREKKQQAFLDAVLARPQDAKNVALAQKAAENLQQTRDAIKSITDQRAATAKQAATDTQAAAKAEQDAAEKAKAARDQSFLQTQENARTAQERLVSRAGDTEGLRDDIQRQQQLHDLLQRQIAVLKASAVDDAAKRGALRDLRNARNDSTDELVRLRAADEQQRQEQKKEALSAQLALAEAQGDTGEQVRLINVRIGQINALIAAHKAEGAALNNLKTERATLQQQREQLQDQRLADQTALAQSIFDLTDNEQPLVKAINAQIRETQADIAAAKKAGKSTVALRTELNNFLLQRKKLLEDADNADTTGGTTLVDLFNKAQDILGGASNVGQTAQSLRDLSANTQIKAQVQQRLDIVNDPAKAAAARQVASTDRLIVAIDLLTQTLTGNTASGTPITRGERNSFKNLSQEQRFFYQKQARLMVEQGLVG